jgi:8-oxo-dGTP pyrophosphatase MutT (NUDIX family)
VIGDGNGWVLCSRGHKHWGRFGAAGLLITDGRQVVLQRRSDWVHEGGTWALPGGARDSSEDVVAAALREAVEEAALDPQAISPFERWVDDHGGWSYTTVLSRPLGPIDVRPVNAESDEIRWWALPEVIGLRLHTGFAAAWPHLSGLINAAFESAGDLRLRNSSPSVAPPAGSQY